MYFIIRSLPDEQNIWFLFRYTGKNNDIVKGVVESGAQRSDTQYFMVIVDCYVIRICSIKLNLSVGLFYNVIFQ